MTRWGVGRLARRQAGVVVIAALALGGLLSFLHVLGDYLQERRRIAEVARSVTTLMAEPAARAAYTLDTALAETVVAALVSIRPVIGAELLDNLGQSLAASAEPVSALPMRWLTDRLFGHELRYDIALDHEVGGRPAATAAERVMGRLVLTLDTRILAENFVSRLGVLVALSLAHGLLLGAVLAAVFHWLVTRPLTMMVAALELLDPGTPPERQLSAGRMHDDDELGRLAQAVNDLLRRVHGALAALRHSQAVRAGIVDHALDAIVTVDEAGRIVDFNPAAERIFGLARAAAIGREAAATLIPRPLRRGHEAALRLLIAAGDPEGTGRRIETEALRADGASFPAEVSISAIRAGEDRLLTLQVRDLSERRAAEAERRRLEDALRRTEKLRALDTLAAGIAHDFNNILATIFASAEVALAGLPEDARPREAIRRILATGKRGRDLVSQIMVLSRIERAPGLAIELDRAVAQAVELCRASLPGNVQLRYSSASEPLLVMAEEAQVQRLIGNLCSNAADAMPDGGLIRVALSRERSAAAPDLACLSVADGGIGMDRETAARLFEPFFTTKPVGKGTGLGLAMVNGIVKSLGGTIDFDTEPGRGTVFRIRLACVAAGRAASTGPALAAQGRGQVVLVVVEEAALRDSLAASLRADGYRVVAHAAPEDALSEAASEPGAQDLLIADAELPGLPGLDLVDAIRAERPDLPAIILTDTPATNADNIRYLRKPVVAAELRHALVETLQTR